MRNFYRKIAVVVCVLLPVALIFVIREKLSWQPLKIATFTDSDFDHFYISPNERFVAKCSERVSQDDSSLPKLVAVENLKNGQEVQCSVSHYPESMLVFSADGMQLAWAWNKTTSQTKYIGVSLWDLKGKLRNFEMVKSDEIFDLELRFSPDGKTLWLDSTDSLRAWDVRSGKLKWQKSFKEPGSDPMFPSQSAISKDCQFYFRFDSHGYAVWNLRTNKRLSLTKMPFLADDLPFFSSDTSLVSYSAETAKGNLCLIIETRTGRVLWQLPSGYLIWAFGGDKAIVHKENTRDDGTESNHEVLDARTGKLLYTLPSVPKASLLRLNSTTWLYSMNADDELYRQRLQ